MHNSLIPARKSGSAARRRKPTHTPVDPDRVVTVAMERRSWALMRARAALATSPGPLSGTRELTPGGLLVVADWLLETPSAVDELRSWDGHVESALSIGGAL